MRIEYLSIMPEKFGAHSRVSTFLRRVVRHVPCASPAAPVLDGARPVVSPWRAGLIREMTPIPLSAHGIPGALCGIESA